MSLNGWRNVLLSRERLENMRLGRVRRQASAMIEECEKTIAELRDAAIQQAAAPALSKIQGELRQLAPQIEKAPDAALKSVRARQKRLHGSIADAQVAALKWSREQAALSARLQDIRSRAEAERKTSPTSESPSLGSVNLAVKQASAALQSGRLQEAESAAASAEQLLKETDKANFDETVRREVVRGLIATLTGMGFVIDGPRLTEAEKNGGVVVLTGRLPSGRMARFNVHVDGRLQFDFDGYEGQSCAKELAQVEKQLQERCDVLLGPTQVTWKNPDRPSKGALNRPHGLTGGVGR